MSPMLSSVNPPMMQPYPTVSICSRDGSLLKKNPRFFDLMAFSCSRYRIPAPHAKAKAASPAKMATMWLMSQKLLKRSLEYGRLPRQLRSDDHDESNQRGGKYAQDSQLVAVLDDQEHTGHRPPGKGEGFMKILDRYPARTDESMPDGSTVADEACQQQAVCRSVKGRLLGEEVGKVPRRAEHIEQNG